MLHMQGEDDGTTLVPVAQYLEARDGEKPLGVYALYDSSRNVQYVGYGRNIILAVKASTRPLAAHALVPGACSRCPAHAHGARRMLTVPQLRVQISERAAGAASLALSVVVPPAATALETGAHAAAQTA